MKSIWRLRHWWASVKDHTDMFDYDDYMKWNIGAMDEDEYNLAIFKGESVEGHAYPMPEWLRRQLHFENVVRVLAVRARYALGALVCRVWGHHIAVEVDESMSGPERPCVDWECRCCGIGGRDWF